MRAAGAGIRQIESVCLVRLVRSRWISDGGMLSRSLEREVVKSSAEAVQTQKQSRTSSWDGAEIV